MQSKSRQLKPSVGEFTDTPASSTTRQWHTLDELTGLVGDADSQGFSRACAIGIAMEFAVGSPVNYSATPVGQFLARLEHSIDRGRLTVVFDRFGQCCGYAHCAAVGPQWRAPALKFGPEALVPTALADKGELFVLDFRTAPGMLTDFMSYLRDGPLKQEHSAIYFRYKNNKRLAKRISRADGSGFAKKSEVVGNSDAEPFLLSSQAGAFFLPTTRAFLSRTAALGELTMALVRSPQFARWPVRLAVQHLQGAVMLNQYRLYRDSRQQPVGALTWAWLPKQARVVKASRWPVLAADEWTDGECLTLRDLWADGRCSAQLAADLATGLFPGESLNVFNPTEDATAVFDNEARKRIGHPESMELVRQANRPIHDRPADRADVVAAEAL